MKNTSLFNEANRATYCPEDNKLRLYVGRVPRDEYDALRAEGWQATAKQDCDFSAVWTVARKNTAESYAGIIEDEDASPQDRAADRAERFSGYLDKRLSEATGHADRYDAGPQVHGFQSYARAVKSADRHDRQAGRALDAWSKAEYWQARTAGVIANALHRSAPGVRMGRIKTIEAEKRQAEKRREDAAKEFARVQSIAADTEGAIRSLAARHYDGDEVDAARSLAESFVGSGKVKHPRNPEREDYISRLMDPKNEDPATVSDFAEYYLARHAAPGSPEWEETGSAQFVRHCELRLAYELQMLEAQGGRAAMVEMEVGGWIGGYQIRKVNKSPATGRVVSVQVLSKGRKYCRKTGEEKPFESLETVNIERASVESYRAPTEEDKAALAATIKAEKAAAPKNTAPALVNPTLEEAQRLQALINERHVAEWIRHHGTPTEHYKPKTAEVCVITQEVYSANASGSYARAETRGLCANGQLEEKFSNLWSQSAQDRAKARGPAVCKVRVTGYDPIRIIHISDKPAKALPAAVWAAYAAPVEQAPVIA